MNSLELTKITRSLLVIASTALTGCASEKVVFGQGPTTKSASAQPQSPSETASAARPERRAEPEPPPPPPPAPPARVEVEAQGSPELRAGIKAYEEGNHREASTALRRALSTRLTRTEQVQAHKYLAFIECSARRTKQCRAEFVKALKIDPSFDLGPAEAGHPLWGPVFRSVKGAKRR